MWSSEKAGCAEIVSQDRCRCWLSSRRASAAAAGAAVSLSKFSHADLVTTAFFLLRAISYRSLSGSRFRKTKDSADAPSSFYQSSFY